MDLSPSTLCIMARGAYIGLYYQPAFTLASLSIITLYTLFSGAQASSQELNTIAALPQSLLVHTRPNPCLVKEHWGDWRNFAYAKAQSSS
jgi:hypothetical protein